MSIRNRLRLSHMAMVLIPIALSVIFTIILGNFFLKDLENAYNFKFNKKATFEQVMEVGSPLFVTIKDVSVHNPSMLEDPTYLKDLDAQLNKTHNDIIIRKASTIIFASPTLNQDDIVSNLPNFSNQYNDKRFHPIIGNEIIRQVDFKFKDGSRGSAFIITDVSYLKISVIQFIVIEIIVIILIMVGTNATLTFLTTKSIVKPLEKLKEGANQIKNGNLDFQLASSSTDEIGQVYAAFEEMRLKLKESLALHQQYESNRKDLISNISHDLKTPITAIRGYVEGIMDGIADSPEKMDKYIKTIGAKANDMERLIDELFLFSKLDLNRLPFNLEDINIKRYLDDCSEELQLDLEETNMILEYRTEIEDTEINIVADREKLKRVITNVISNSIKYMDKGYGKVIMELKDYDEFILIKIQDNGKGISKESLPFIFDRFFRGDASRNTLAGGSGLGLAICKLIIEELGGTLWAESEENFGTTIYFTLKKV